MVMERKLQTMPTETGYSEFTDRCDLESLLHPAQAFEHPSNVVTDPDLTLNEKRAILASWASDACAVEAIPHLRCAPGGKRRIRFDDVVEALRTLDKQANDRAADGARYLRVVRRRPFEHHARPGSRERRSIN